MSITIAMLKAAGLCAEQIVAVLEAQEADQAKIDEASRIKNRDRMRAVRAANKMNDIAQHAQPPQVSSSPPSSSPTPPITPTPSPSSPSSSLRSDSIESDWPKDFREQFWNVYPRKVGKKTAIRKLELVRRNGEIAWVPFLAAIARIDRKDPQFIPHPATWLTQGRYLDGMATGPPAESKPAYLTPPPGMKSYEETLQEFRNGEAAGVRGNPSLGQNGADHASELRLSGGSPLQIQEPGAQRSAPDDQNRH